MRAPLDSDGILGYAETTVTDELMKAHFFQTPEDFTSVPAVSHRVLKASFTWFHCPAGTRKSRAVPADKYMS